MPGVIDMVMRPNSISIFIRRIGSARRKLLFEFEPPQYEESVTIKGKEDIEIPLEVHPIGSYGPSLIPFNEALLEDLACPISGEPLKFDRKRNLLISEAIKYAFPINKAGMPLFLKRWAIPLAEIEDDKDKDG